MKLRAYGIVARAIEEGIERARVLHASDEGTPYEAWLYSEIMTGLCEVVDFEDDVENLELQELQP